MSDFLDFENRIKDNLYELFAKDMKTARNEEIYTSLAKTLRYYIGKKWSESNKKSRISKVLYILSFEYSFGNRLISNSIKLDKLEEIKKILEKYDIDFEKIKEYDMEFALGYGDLGNFSGDLLDYLANRDRNVYAYGLRYRKGMLKQEIKNGSQVEKPDDWKVNKNPWEHEKGFSHYVNFKDYSVKAVPYDIPVLSSSADRVNTLRLWKSESVSDIDFEQFSAGNIQEAYKNVNKANSIVEFLYPQEDSHNGKVLRLSQEYFFASSSIQDILKKYKKYIKKDIRDIHEYIDIQLNDIHPTLAILEFIYQLMKKYSLPFEKALAISKKVFIFVNSSLLPENFESWDIAIFKEVCPQLMEVGKLLDEAIRKDFSHKRCNSIIIEDVTAISHGKIHMNNIAYFVSHKIITTSRGERWFLDDSYLNKLGIFYSNKLEAMEIYFDSCQYLKENNKALYSACLENNLNENVFESIKLENKLDLIEKLCPKDLFINPKSVFIMNLGVFHEYKRQLLSCLSIALLYYRLKKNSNLDVGERTYFFGGKSYPNYYLAKETIRFINALANLINNDLTIQDKIKLVFVENYNIRKSTILVPACDIYEDLPLIQMETTDLNILKYLVNGSHLIQAKSNRIEGLIDDNLLYSFGDSRDEYFRELKDKTYNVDYFLALNEELDDMFEFYKSIPSNLFSYDIKNIYNAIYYFNDNYHVLKDLSEHYELMNELCGQYRKREKWIDDSINIINQAQKYAIENRKINFSDKLES
ncbi:glycogen/starch/alpha-glucan phosphorylase [Peptoniphilaceae bacterium SGI.131]